MQNAKEIIRKLLLEIDVLEKNSMYPNSDIAIIGMSGAFPMADNIDEFWHNIVNQRDCVSNVPLSRWQLDKAENLASPYCGFLKDVEHFDARFFSLGEKEALVTDPQQRLLLEHSWRCIEHAGLNAAGLSGEKCGVFVGVASGDYTGLMDDIDIFHYMGNGTDAYAGRLSYYLNLNGPCMAINTGCSSALVAIANACDSLVHEHSDLALAGGVRVLSSAATHKMMGDAEMLSTSGRCYSFDNRADGTIPSEGVGVVMLKRLSDALQDGDSIQAVIKGWGVNQDGKTNGLTAPSGDSQARLITQVYQKYGIDPETIDLIEAHGTGTKLGDPIELMALDKAYKQFTDKQAYCAVGTVKSNIGHTLEAAGVAGMIKLVQSLQHQTLPPTINYQDLNEEIQLSDSALYINTELSEWHKSNDTQRRCAISSFGLSGTNAHVVLEEAPQGIERQAPEVQRPLHVLPLSAKSEVALDDQINQYQDYLNKAEEKYIDLGDICYTAGVGRSHFDYRLAVVGESIGDMVTKLQSKDFIKNKITNQGKPKIAWLFTGQGSQRIKLGHVLYDTHLVFKQTIDQCVQHLKDKHDYDFNEVWRSEDDALIAQTQHTQVLLFVVEYALAQLWLSFGVKPDYVCGHSVGETVAAVIAGVMSLEDGLTLIYHRGRLMQSLPYGGGMLVALADLKTIKLILKNNNLDLSIAGINAPRQVVLSGKVAEIKKLESILGKKEIRAIALNVSHAFHSKLMQPMCDEFKAIASEVEFKGPQIKLLSNVTGDFIKESQITAGYWVEHILSAVNFASCVKTIEQAGCDIYHEVGPDGELIGLAQQTISNLEAQFLASLSRDATVSDWQSILGAIGHLYTQGVEIDWEEYDKPFLRQKVLLPTYPFQRERYWVENQKQKNISLGDNLDHPLLLFKLSSPIDDVVYSSCLSLKKYPYLQDHQVFGYVILPGTGLLEMMMAVAVDKQGRASLKAVHFDVALRLQLGEVSNLQIVLKEDEVGERVTVYSQTRYEHWQEHAHAYIAHEDTINAEVIDIDLYRQKDYWVDTDNFYLQLSDEGLYYGESFQAIKAAYVSDLGFLSKIEVDLDVQHYWAHPALLDSALHSLMAMQYALDHDVESMMSSMPVSIEELVLLQPLGNTVWILFKQDEMLYQENQAISTVYLLSDTGTVLGYVKGIRAKEVSRTQLLSVIDTKHDKNIDSWFYEIVWESKRPFSDKKSSNGEYWITFGASDDTVSALRKSRPMIRFLHVNWLGSHSDLNVFDSDAYLDSSNDLEIETFFNNVEKEISGVMFFSNPDSHSHLMRGELIDTYDLPLAGLFHAIQYLAKKKQFPRLVVVTQNAVPFEVNEPLHITGSLPLGFIKTVALEYPQFQSLHIDLDSKASLESNIESMFCCINDPSHESQWLLRDELTYVSRLQHKRISAKQNVEFSSNSSYLITGGTGGLGLVCAQWLIDRGALNIVLVSRSQPDASVRAQLSDWDSQGVNIQFRSCDVSSVDNVRELLAESIFADYPLKGVVHAAGVNSQIAISDLHWDELTRVMRSKVNGAWNLHINTLDCDLEFFIGYSSISSMLGSAKMAAYVSANAFLDALMAYRRQIGLVGQSINWGPWSTVGFMAKSSASNGIDSDLMSSLINSEQGTEVLNRLVLEPYSHVGIVSPDYLQYMMNFVPETNRQFYEHIDLRHLLSSTKATKRIGSAQLRAQLKNMSDDEGFEYVRDLVSKELAYVLGVSDYQSLDLNLGFFEQGLDSLMSLEFKNRLQRWLGDLLLLDNYILFNHDNVTNLSNFIFSNLTKKLSEDPNNEGTAISGTNTNLNIEYLYDEIKCLGVDLTQDKLKSILIKSQEPIQYGVKILNNLDRFPLSFGQERLWFIDQLHGHNSAEYNESFILEISNNISINRLENSINDIINKHSILRTFYPEDEQGVHQKISIEYKAVSVVKCEFCTALEDIKSLKDMPFDLKARPPFYVKIYSLTDRNVNVIFVNQHHILTDGKSINLIIAEFYRRLNNNQDSYESDESLVQNRDYSVWQREKVDSGAWDYQLHYWEDHLRDSVRPEFPLDKPRPVRFSNKGDFSQTIFNEEDSELIKIFLKDKGITLYMFMSAVLSILMSRWCNQNDILFTSPVSGRQQSDINNTLGFFVNNIAIRNIIDHDQSVTEFFSQVKAISIEAYKHQDLPYNIVLSKLNEDRDMSVQPLTGLSLTVHESKMTLDASNFTGIRFIPLGVHPAMIEMNSDYSTLYEDYFRHDDIGFEVAEIGGEICVGVSFCRDLFYKNTIERLLTYFKNIALYIVDDASAKIKDIEMLPPKEKHQLLVEWNDTAVDYPREKTIHQLFEEQVEKTPHNTAIVYEETSLSYHALNKRSNQLAHYLLGLGVQTEMLIPLCLDRSLEMIIAILAVLKAGGAYVPIEPELPLTRKQYMLQDLDSLIFITQSKLADTLPAFDGLVIFLDQLNKNEDLLSQSVSNTHASINSSNLAYVIYTSGSTGFPKGVMVEHRNIVNYFMSIQEYASMSSLSRIDCSSSMAFDLSVSTSIVPLVAGSSMILCANKIKREPELYMQYLSDQNIDMIKTTPSFISLVGDVNNSLIKFSSLKTIILGGEALQTSYVNRLFENYPNTIIINEYGPTETTVGVTQLTFEIKKFQDSSENVSIGSPCINSKVYLFDHNQRLVPVGVTGELTICGDQVARGYLNQPELTAEKFIDNPFATEEDKKLDRNLRLYKTGDLARWLPDGNLEFVGRIDDQVKIRGFRIELGEIESVLSQFSDVSQCVVLAKGENQDKKLVAYVVSEANVELDQATIRTYLKNQLPDHMTPSFFITLDSLPLNRNGKIDRKALPEPNKIVLTRDNEYIAPLNENERILCDIFQSVLKLEQISIHDNFFHIGGDSIVSIQVVSRARDAGLVLKVRDIFDYQTIAELVANVDFMKKQCEAEQGQLEGESDFLPIQLDFLSTATNIHYNNQSVLLKFDEKLDLAILQQAIHLLIKQHDALRLRLSRDDDSFVQYYCTDSKAYSCEIESIDCQEKSGEMIISECCQKMQSSLSLFDGPVMRVGHFSNVNESSERLFIVIHHMMVDGVSWRILLKDLFDFYKALLVGDGIELHAKTSSYREWVSALKEYAIKPSTQAQLDYWLDTVERIPRIFNDTTTRGHEESFEIVLNDTQTQLLLHKSNAAYNTQINDLLLTALTLAFSETFEVNCLPLSLESHGREHIVDNVDVSETVGWFTSVYPVVLDLGSKVFNGSDEAIAYQIKSIKEQLRSIPDMGLSYGVLKHFGDENIQLELTPRNQPAIEFNYMGQFTQDDSDQTQPFSILSESMGELTDANNSRSNPISINGQVIDGRLTLFLAVSTDCVESALIDKLAERYQFFLRLIIDHCSSGQFEGVTASDFSSSGLTTKELEELFYE